MPNFNFTSKEAVSAKTNKYKTIAIRIFLFTCMIAYFMR